MEITEVNNIGRVVKGTIFDCNRQFLDRKLKELDKRLYTSWNPYKNQGRGTWEIRILPSTKTPVYYGEFEGKEIYRLEYLEDSMVHHIMDVPCLYIGIIERLKQIDTKNVINNYSTYSDWLEYEEDRAYNKEDKKLKEELMYQLRHEKKYVQALYEAARDGYNPASFFRGTKIIGS